MKRKPNGVQAAIKRSPAQPNWVKVAARVSMRYQDCIRRTLTHSSDDRSVVERGTYYFKI